MRTIALIASVAALAAMGGRATAQPVAQGQTAYGEAAYASNPGSTGGPMAGPFNPAPSTAEGAGLRLLSWPGKVQRAPAARAAARPRAWTADPAQSTAYRPLPVQTPRRLYEPGPPEPPVRAMPTQAVQAQPLPPPAPPTSIYAPPPSPTPPLPSRPAASAAAPPAPTVRALASAEPVGSENLRPRFYSVHRPYGAEPDPIELTPQFLNQGSPDLATPPPPVPRATVNGAGNVVRPAPPPPEPAN